MSQSGINYEAITELSNRLKKVQTYSPVILDLWLHKMVGPALVKEMQDRAPVDSGDLKRAIRAISAPGKVSVAPYGISYNRYVVEGTKPHDIVPKKGTRLVFQVGGRTVYARKVRHPGTKANPYMSDAADAVMARMLPKLGQLAVNVMKTGTVGSAT